MIENQILDLIDIKDRIEFNRFKALIDSDLRPMFIIIGASTLKLAEKFVVFTISTIPKLDYTEDFNSSTERIELRELLLDTEKDFIFLFSFDTNVNSTGYKNSINTLESLYANRDLIVHNKHRIILIVNRSFFNLIMHEYHDLFSTVNFSYFFFQAIEEVNANKQELINKQYLYLKSRFNQPISYYEKAIYGLQASIWLRRMGNFKDALNLLNLSLKFLNQVKDNKNDNQINEIRAEIFINYGKTYLETKLLDKSIESFEKGIYLFNALTADERNKDNRLFLVKRSIINQIRVGRVYKEEGKLDKAKEIYSLVLQQIEKNEKALVKMDSSVIKGYFFKSRSLLYKELFYYFLAKGEISKAREYIKEKEKLANSLKTSQLSFAYVYEDYGRFYFYQGDWENAKFYFTKAQNIFQKYGAYRYIAIIHISLAKLYFYTVGAGYAYGVFNRALRVSQEHNFYDLIVDSYLNIGWVLFHKGDFDNALRIIDIALKISGEHGFKKGITKSAFYLVIIYTCLKKYSQAQKFLAYLEDTEQMKYQKCLVRALLAKGFYFIKNGEVNSALNQVKRGLTIADKMNFIFLKVCLLYVQGLCLWAQGQKQKALDSFSLGYQLAVEYHYSEGQIINGFHKFDAELNHSISEETSYTELKRLANISEDSRLYVFLPAFYKKLAMIGDDKIAMNFYQKRMEFYRSQFEIDTFDDNL